MDFKEYQSRPIVRKAYEIKGTDGVVYESSKTARIAGTDIRFAYYEDVKPGDFIVYLNASDIYHCTRKVFEERNII